jgi:hypothetical protein
MGKVFLALVFMENVYFMNKSQRIYFSTGDTGNDIHVKVKLEEDTKTLEFLTMKVDTEDVYQDFNADYGVLIGRVIANGGIGVPNAKISIFIPLDDVDTLDGQVTSIYPYTTPRDKNNEGKRYNLLPRVSQYEQSTGLFKPKQPFGSFPIKPEIVTNELYLNVYKKYYKYTALTNGYGDYMIFGVPIGTQTVHLSVDITDIGKYSMTPASMIKAGYPANLFTDDAAAIKPSTDLTDLPNIETQEITVDVIPFWGDATNFEIGITRQDFRVKAILNSNFVIFGTSMTMGITAMFGNPDKKDTNAGFYALSDNTNNNMDIRVNRVAPFEIRVFTYTSDIPIDINGNLQIPADINYDTQIRELDKSEYFEYNVNGNFLLSIPCNRRKIITDENGSDVVVADNYSAGVFTKFYGMVLARYPDLPNEASFNKRFNGGNNCYKARGWFKIPQTIGLRVNDVTYKTNNDNWRKEYHTFNVGDICSVAEFLPTKSAAVGTNPYVNVAGLATENTFANDRYYNAGAWFKVAGEDKVVQEQQFDNANYIIDPSTGVTPQYKYDFSPNVTSFNNPSNPQKEAFFGGQWLNFCLYFPQYGWAYSAGNNRGYRFADVYHNDYETTYFDVDNQQKLFANITNSKWLLKGDAFQTAFISIPRTELGKLLNVPLKGLNIRRWNAGQEPDHNTNNIILSAAPYKYLNVFHVPMAATTGRDYNKYGWDAYAPYTGVPSGEPQTAYLFRGMYENDCIKMLSDLSII